MNFKTIIKEKGLAISEISLQEALRRNRLDAEFYNPLYLSYEKKLEEKGCKEIRDFSKTTDGIHASIDFDDDSGINLLSAMSPKENYFDISRNKTISKLQHEKNPRTELKEDDVIVSTVGTIGNCAVVDKSVLPANSDRHIGIIRIKSDYLPHFLSTFLLSKYGRFQTLREATGNVQLNLFIEKIDTLKIPTASKHFQEAVSGAVIKALDMRQRASDKYNQAEKYLLEEINLAGYKPSQDSISVRSLKACIADNRFDAEFWQPKYDEMQKRVSGVSQKELGELVSMKKGVEVGSEAYGEQGKGFLRVSDFSIYGIEKPEKKISETLYDGLKENYRPKRGEVLFTKDGTIGITFALDEEADVIISSAFLRMKPKSEINNQYLALALNSIYCKSQIERMSGGAIIAHLKPDNVKKIKVPLLPENKQLEMADMVIEALNQWKQAAELMDRAKTAVELSVEKNEEEALTFLK